MLLLFRTSTFLQKEDNLNSLFLAPPDFKPKNLKLSQTSSDCVRLDWENPYTDVEANYQVYMYNIY